MICGLFAYWEPEMSIEVGSRVLCRCPDSWVDGREAVVEQMDSTSSDGIRGCLLRVPGHGLTVVELTYLEPIKEHGAREFLL